MGGNVSGEVIVVNLWLRCVCGSKSDCKWM